jgi:hypothetical protein
MQHENKFQSNNNLLNDNLMANSIREKELREKWRKGDKKWIYENWKELAKKN